MPVGTESPARVRAATVKDTPSSGEPGGSAGATESGRRGFVDREIDLRPTLDGRRMYALGCDRTPLEGDPQLTSAGRAELPRFDDESRAPGAVGHRRPKGGASLVAQIEGQRRDRGSRSRRIAVDGVGVHLRSSLECDRAPVDRDDRGSGTNERRTCRQWRSTGKSSAAPSSQGEPCHATRAT